MTKKKRYRGSQNPDRDREMRRLRDKKGLKLREIGELFGVSRQRVLQCIARFR